MFSGEAQHLLFFIKILEMGQELKLKNSFLFLGIVGRRMWLWKEEQAIA